MSENRGYSVVVWITPNDPDSSIASWRGFWFQRPTGEGLDEVAMPLVIPSSAGMVELEELRRSITSNTSHDQMFHYDGEAPRGWFQTSAPVTTDRTIKDERHPPRNQIRWPSYKNDLVNETDFQKNCLLAWLDEIVSARRQPTIYLTGMALGQP